MRSFGRIVVIVCVLGCVLVYGHNLLADAIVGFCAGYGAGTLALRLFP